MKRAFHILTIFGTVLVSLGSCSKEGRFPEGEGGGHSQIPVVLVPDPLDIDVETKTTAVTSLSSFYASATTGSAGSETSKWNSVTFTGSTNYTGGKYWPSTSTTYNFYASNAAITFAAGGSTVAATNSTDVICAYSPSATYASPCALTFNHIFARLGSVTTAAVDGYTISSISASITPKTGGTYNIRTGNGQTDGTGWSGLTTGSATSIANSAIGTKSNDIWLVPGSYTVTVTWTATKGDYSKTFTNQTKSVSLVGGKINNIIINLSGDAEAINLGVSIAGWSTVDVDLPRPEKP